MNVRIDRTAEKAVPYTTFEKCMELKDLALYMALRDEFGFGKARLERVFHASYRIYTQYTVPGQKISLVLYGKILSLSRRIILMFS